MDTGTSANRILGPLTGFQTKLISYGERSARLGLRLVRCNDRIDRRSQRRFGTTIWLEIKSRENSTRENSIKNEMRNNSKYFEFFSELFACWMCDVTSLSK